MSIKKSAPANKKSRRLVKLLPFFCIAAAIASYRTPGETVAYHPLTGNFSHYRSIALIYEESGGVEPEKAGECYQKINSDLMAGLQQLGYDPIYGSKDARKADCWIKIRLIIMSEWNGRKVCLYVKFIDPKLNRSISEIAVYGNDDSGPAVLAGVGANSIAVAYAGMALPGPLGNAVENADKEILNYMDKNQ